jgi:CRP-like cAMP-binding protein
LHNIHHYDELCSIGAKLTLSKGVCLRDLAKEAADVFVLDAGIVSVSTLSMQGNEQTILYLTPRWLINIVPSFLEKELIEDRNEDYKVEHYTRTDCVLYQISSEDFTNFLKQRPLLAESVIYVLTHNLFSANRHYFQMQDLPVCLRLCKVLLDLDKGHGIEPFFTAEELSNHIGSHPVTVSKIIAELKKQNIVSRSGRRLFIQDRERLARIVKERKQFDY